jgi:hypothetical protein
MAWNLGNTSIRNPWRIQDGLRIFATEFSGNCEGPIREELLVRRLIAAGLVSSGKVAEDIADIATDGMSPKVAVPLHGRKWRSCFCKLGFITERVYLAELKQASMGFTGKPYELTPAGNRLLAADSKPAIADIFLRQLLRLELPSPTEKEKDIVQIKPLILLLQILADLEKFNDRGLNLIEIACFVQTAKSHIDYGARIDRLLSYRKERSTLSQSKKRIFDSKLLAAELVVSRLKLKPGSLIDYADTTIRHCRMTGLFSSAGEKIVLRDESRSLVDEILSREPQFLAKDHPLDYLIDFYKGTAIPTDNETVALKEIRAFEQRLVALGKKPVVQVSSLKGISAQDLSLARHNIESQFYQVKESDFAISHAKDNGQILDVVKYLRTLNGDRSIADIVIDDKPSYLEWVVWRALLIFNNLVVEPYNTRNFEIDNDLLPVRCAPGGKADMVMDYADYVAVVEVTMKTGSRQEAAEGEPVRRHVADIMRITGQKEVYGLFIAPEIDNNTADTFGRGVWYQNEQRYDLNIVPLSISQLIAIIESLLSRRRTTMDLKLLFDRCLRSRNAAAPAWLSEIEKQVNIWLKQLT